jgi:hypothetical protein
VEASGAIRHDVLGPHSGTLTFPPVIRMTCCISDVTESCCAGVYRIVGPAVGQCGDLLQGCLVNQVLFGFTRAPVISVPTLPHPGSMNYLPDSPNSSKGPVSPHSDHSTRRFSPHSQKLSQAFILARMNETHTCTSPFGLPIFISAAVQQWTQSAFSTKQILTSGAPVFRLCDRLTQVDCDEWMYMLAESSKKDRYVRYNKAFTLFHNGHLENALQLLTEYLQDNQEDDDALSLLAAIKTALQ